MTVQFGARLESPFEQRMVARFRAGEPEALGFLFDFYVDRIFAYARHMLGNRADAEEVTSEAFLRALERAEQFREEHAFRSWLFTITRNLCLDRLRQPRLPVLSELEERTPAAGPDSAATDTTIVVRQALATLPRDQQMALLLCDVEQWDAKEAARMLEKSLAATKSALYRGRRSLKSKLAEIWEDGGTDAM